MNRNVQLCWLACVVAVPGLCADSVEPGGRVKSDVRADRRSGRLVRRVTIEPLAIAGRLIPKTPAPYVQRDPVAAPLARNAKIDEIVDRAAKQYDVDPLLVHAVIQVESAYNPYAISPVGAQGLMQLMPGTARSLGVRNSFDVEENIRAGVKHLKDLQQTYKDDRLALAAYNAGAGAVNRYRWIPPFPETQEYVYKVGKKYGEARKAVAARAVPPKPETPRAEELPAEAAAPRAVEAFLDAEGRLHMRTK